MDPRVRNLVIAALVPLAIFFMLFRVTSRRPSPEPPNAQPSEGAPTALAVEVSPSPVGERTYSYALDLLSLGGLPPDLEPGAAVELWVTWSSGKRAARPERWVTGARFQRIVPAITPTGPDVAIIEIPAEARRKMVWADTFGLLTLFASP